MPDQGRLTAVGSTGDKEIERFGIAIAFVENHLIEVVNDTSITVPIAKIKQDLLGIQTRTNEMLGNRLKARFGSKKKVSSSDLHVFKLVLQGGPVGYVLGELVGLNVLLNVEA